MTRKALTLAIVIPVYNEERYLPACLDSIAGQITKADEVIVVDNNSTDRSAEIAKKYNFVKLLSEPKQGIVHARSRGYEAVKSDIIGRVDADVVLPKTWVASVKEFYKGKENSEMALTGGGYPNNLRFPKVCAWLQGHIAFRVNKLLLGHYILFGSNMAVPKKLWRAVRPHVCARSDVHEDLDLAIHLHRLGFKIAYKPALMVSGKAKRVISERSKLLSNLMMWPNTLRAHGLKTWVFGWLGAVILYFFSPIPLFLEYGARFIGKRPLSE